MDSEKQKDEICALESIYNAEEFSYFRQNNSYEATLKIFSVLPQNFCITYKDGNGPEIEEKRVSIDHLPPLTLAIVLPPEYPSSSPPKYTLRSSWLRYSAMLKLCKELNRLWELNQGQEILFTWMNFLQNDLLEFLNIQNSINIDHALVYYQITKQNNERGSKMHTIYTDPNQVVSNNEHTKAGSSHNAQKKLSIQRKKKFSSRHKSQDARVVCDIVGNKNPLQMLIDYNEMRSQLQFMRNCFTCSICFIEKLGEHCIKFKPCSHVFCNDCIASYVRVKIGDGSVQNILCPEGICESELHFSQVKELLSSEEFYRFDSMLLNSTLDTMDDIIYCPRRGCQYPVTKEGDEKMAACPMCSYVFCIYCKMVYHGIEPCKINIVVKDLSAEEVAELERRYGERQVQLMLENSQSEDWIYTHSQMCPRCYTPIEKLDGCNKMTCWKCRTFFCWNCLQKLEPKDPYSHYRNPLSKCFEKLWPRELENYNEHQEDGDQEGFEEPDAINNYFRIFYV